LAASRGETDSNSYWTAMSAQVQRLPLIHQKFLRRLCATLARFARHETENKMSSANLAIVFAPNTLYPKADPNNTFLGVQDLPLVSGIWQTLIDHWQTIFSYMSDTPPPDSSQQTPGAAADSAHEQLSASSYQAADTEDGAAAGQYDAYPLPPGWSAHTTDDGNVYYVGACAKGVWVRLGTRVGPSVELVLCLGIWECSQLSPSGESTWSPPSVVLPGGWHACYDSEGKPCVVSVVSVVSPSVDGSSC
jgi:hypothetical protein